MVSTYTASNRLMMPAKSDLKDSWATAWWQPCAATLDQALDGVEFITVSAPVTLTTVLGGVDQARNRGLVISGTGGTVTVPSVEKFYFVDATAATGNITFTKGSGTTAIVPRGICALVRVDINGCYSFYLSQPGAVVLSTTNITAVNNINIALPAGFRHYRAVVAQMQHAAGANRTLTFGADESGSGFNDTTTLTSGSSYSGFFELISTEHFTKYEFEYHTGSPAGAAVCKPNSALNTFNNMPFNLSAGTPFTASGTIILQGIL